MKRFVLFVTSAVLSLSMMAGVVDRNMAREKAMKFMPGKRFVESKPFASARAQEPEKPDAFYRMGYCYLFNNDTVTATEYFQAALDYYQRFRNTQSDQPRIAQIQTMIRSLAPDNNAVWQADNQQIPTDPQTVRDTLRNRIINDIDLSDIYEHQIIVEDE